MTTAEAVGHVLVGTLTGAMMLAGGWWMVAGLILVVAWALKT